MNLTAFAFDNKEVRFVDGLPVANDVAIALGYAAPAKTISTKVDPENRTLTKTVTQDGKTRELTLLTEAGIYQLIFSSKLESAKRFKDWVFNEVLPSIRKTGSYAIDPQSQLPTTYLDALKALVSMEEAKAIADAEMALLEEQNHQLAEAVDELFNYSSIIRIAKFNKVSETLFKWQTLKAVSNKMGLEIKRVPSPRFEYQNLYSHDVWRVCYPAMKLPETTTLVINRV